MAMDGKHPDGHPLRPLYWLANYLAQRGDPLRAGMIVTTGSYCGVVDVPLDVPLTVVYGDLGSLVRHADARHRMIARNDERSARGRSRSRMARRRGRLVRSDVR